VKNKASYIYDQTDEVLKVEMEIRELLEEMGFSEDNTL